MQPIITYGLKKDNGPILGQAWNPEREKMKLKKRNYLAYVVLLIMAACLTAGCSTAPAADKSAVSIQYERIFPFLQELASVQRPAVNIEWGSSSVEETVISEMPKYATEEEIAALGIPEDMLAYWMVLNGKKPFVSTDEEYQEFYWDEYYWYLGEIRGRRQADYFTIVDMNGDGENEIVLECSPESAQILHYEDGIVYSYQFIFRGMKRIHNNGIYEGSDGVASTFYYRLTELNKDGYTEETIAGMDGDYYEVEGAEAVYEEFCEYVDAIENVELAECIEFTESMLDRQLLGNLSEREITLVKMLPTEKTIENEIDYQEHKQALQLYAAVLTGEQDVIFVTEDRFKYADETLAMYFSLVDLDGDGVLELVFSCDYDVVWILHYEDGKVYGYHLRPAPVITMDGVFRTDDKELSSTGYARIAAFEEDGCLIEPVKNYESGSHDRVRYYFFSEETMAQWLEFENVQQFSNTITDDMLNAIEEYPSLEAYWNDSLILLNQINKNVRLYGINVNGQTAMLLCIEGEKILIEEDPFPSFLNLYEETPKLNMLDVDNDGVDEVIISLVTVTGSPISRYAMLVCDCEDKWNVYMYDNYLEDVRDIIWYRYDDKNNMIAFLDNNDDVLWEGKLPEWTNEYVYTGVVNFGDNIRFDAETFQMDIIPEIELENSLPYEPIRITFNLSFTNGRFKIASYDINLCREVEAGEVQ